MASSQHLVVVIVVLFLVITCSSAYEKPWGSYCGGSVRTANNSGNLDELLASMVQSFKVGARFIASTYGRASDYVMYGLGSCRVDVHQRTCSECIEAAFQEIQRSCGDKTDAQIWYDYCSIRFSRRSFFGQFDISPAHRVWIQNGTDYENPVSLRDGIVDLFNELKDAATSPTRGGSAPGNRRLPERETMHGFVQCTKDLSAAACAECLDAAVDVFLNGFCKGKRGCRVFYSSCSARYELYNFIIPPHKEPFYPTQALTDSAIIRKFGQRK